MDFPLSLQIVRELGAFGVLIWLVVMQARQQERMLNLLLGRVTELHETDTAQQVQLNRLHEQAQTPNVVVLQEKPNQEK